MLLFVITDTICAVCIHYSGSAGCIVRRVPPVSWLWIGIISMVYHVRYNIRRRRQATRSKDI